jgi:hypothetical protein
MKNVRKNFDTSTFFSLVNTWNHSQVAEDLRIRTSCFPRVLRHIFGMRACQISAHRGAFRG